MPVTDYDQLSVTGEDYGRSRLEQVVRDNCHVSSQLLVNTIFADVDRFGAGAGAYDDQTLLVLRVK